MILQVHDELIFEVVESKVAEVVPVIERMMTSVLQESWIQYHTTVPLLVSTSVAGNWGAKG
jgi:DNA polymerase I-like protein with 3'-5' exonuclease and polymerase domains